MGTNRRGAARRALRRGWDSNPRYPCEYNSLAGSPIRPLSHLSRPCAPEPWRPAATVSLDAEREGFEPPEPCGSTVFKTASFDHSDTSPRRALPVLHNMTTATGCQSIILSQSQLNHGLLRAVPAGWVPAATVGAGPQPWSLPRPNASPRLLPGRPACAPRPRCGPGSAVHPCAHLAISPKTGRSRLRVPPHGLSSSPCPCEPCYRRIIAAHRDGLMICAAGVWRAPWAQAAVTDPLF